jgi:hypothetical protein
MKFKATEFISKLKNELPNPASFPPRHHQDQFMQIK